MSHPSVLGQDRASGITFGKAHRAEWIKLRSLRSRWLLAAFVCGVLALIGWMNALDSVNTIDPTSGRNVPDSGVLAAAAAGGVALMQFVVPTIGAIYGAREFGSGLIRTTLLAVPKRTTVLLAKLTVFAWWYGIVISFGLIVPWIAGVLIVGTDSTTAAWDINGPVRILAGNVVYLVVVGLVGVAIGFITRNVAGAISLTVGGVILLPYILGGVIGRFAEPVLQFTLVYVSRDVISIVQPDTMSFPPGVAWLVLAAWVVAAVTLAAITLRRRDA